MKLNFIPRKHLLVPLHSALPTLGKIAPTRKLDLASLCDRIIDQLFNVLDVFFSAA